MGASYTGAIELRRCVVRWTRTPSGGISEDSDAVTFHLAKLTGGAVDANWLTADYTAAEARIDTWWTALKVNAPTWQKLAEIRWYKDGPAWSPSDRGDGPANPATRTVSRAVLGTAAGAMMPPQIAITITKIVDVRKRWGRFYLVLPYTGLQDTNGRITGKDALLTATVAMFNGFRADGKQPVVWSRGRSAYISPRGTAIDAHAATAYEITSLQIDDLFDVQRSRRWSQPTARTTTALT